VVCLCLQTWHGHRRSSPVVHLDRAFSLVHHWGRNFYHSMLEVLPHVLQPSRRF